VVLERERESESVCVCVCVCVCVRLSVYTHSPTHTCIPTYIVDDNGELDEEVMRKHARVRECESARACARMHVHEQMTMGGSS